MSHGGCGLLCQRVAQRANGEDEEHGRFFQDRYKSVRLLDEASLLVCTAYVDLNPVRAAMAQTVEQSDHTSVQRRIEGMREEASEEQRPKVDPTGPSCQCIRFALNDRRSIWFAGPLWQHDRGSL